MDVSGTFSDIFKDSSKNIEGILSEFQRIIYVLNPNMDEKIEMLCDDLKEAKENGKRVHIMGSGRSGLVGGCFALRLEHFGFDVSYSRDTIQKKILSGDLIMSYSGSSTTRETVGSVEVAKGADAKIYVFTTYPGETLAKLADSPKHVFVIPGGLTKGKDWTYYVAQLRESDMPMNQADYSEYEEIENILGKMPEAFYLGGGYEGMVFLFNEALTTTIGKYLNITPEDAIQRHVQDGILKT